MSYQQYWNEMQGGSKIPGSHFCPNDLLLDRATPGTYQGKIIVDLLEVWKSYSRARLVWCRPDHFAHFVRKGRERDLFSIRLTARASDSAKCIAWSSLTFAGYGGS
jgi:hypothetical protein